MWVPPTGTFRQTVLGGCRWYGDPAGLLRHNLALQTGITGWGPQPALLEVGHHCSGNCSCSITGVASLLWGPTAAVEVMFRVPILCPLTTNPTAK